MKRFSPYTTYTQNGQQLYTSTAPDGAKLSSHTWHDDRIADILSLFEIKQLKSLQPQIIRSILSGNDTLAVMPTGSGKTLCFQAPSIFFPGITIVITPLIALIENQVHNFNRFFEPFFRRLRHPKQVGCYRRVHFKAIYPGMNGLFSNAMFDEILNPRQPQQAGQARRTNNIPIQYKFLYVSPERLANPKFLRALSSAEEAGLQISHVVIDEVHCMSQWGFEFRESYLGIANFIKQRPIRPIISGFTATATPKDIQAIKSFLGFPQASSGKKYQEFINVSKRQNLSLQLVPCANDDNPGAPNTRLCRLNSLLEQNRTKVCIIYRTTTVGVDELYTQLQENPLLKERLVKYHAQMPAPAKNRSKNAFLNSYDESRRSAPISPLPCKNIMIATKAFGMGIDKQDISLIIHYDIPRSLEDYYQEVGRAGRNTKLVPKAQCCLLYATGPINAKGTLEYTINWITSDKTSAGSGCMPIYSQFSTALQENIYFWSYYRLCYVMTYCRLAAQSSSGNAHDFIISYLKNQLTPEQTAADLQSFYNYLFHQYPCPKAKRSQFITGCLFTPRQAAAFLNTDSPADNHDNIYHAEIKRLIAQVNELHINNTYVANLLRHKPQKYQLNTPYNLEDDSPRAGQEWKSQKNKKVKGQSSQTLRPTDIHENAAFIFADPTTSPQACQQYVNAAWQALVSHQKQPRRPSLIFTVNYYNEICGVLKRQAGSWQLLNSTHSLQPYQRYLGCSVKGLFPKEFYGGWRRTKANLRNSDISAPATPAAAQELFVYAAGARRHQLTFTIHGDEKLSYFDMCVLDAIYSIQSSRKETIYVQTIWQLLTGRNPHYSSQEKRSFHTAIQSSIQKMRGLSLSLSDNQCGFTITSAPFLPLLDKPQGEKGYAYTEIPPLFLYAEQMNGQIIKIPISLLNVAKAPAQALWRDDFSGHFPLVEPNLNPFGSSRKRSFSEQVKCIACTLDRLAKYTAQISQLLTPKAQRQLTRLSSRPYRFSPSIANAQLSHYLLHRIAISKNRKRGSFILFETIKATAGSGEDSSLFNKKVAALLAYYQSTGYLLRYYTYITNHPYRLASGQILTDTAYFQITTNGSLKYWQQDTTAHLVLSDFTTIWSSKYNDQLADDNSNFELRSTIANALNRQKQQLSPEAARELAAIPLSRMDGIVLQHN